MSLAEASILLIAIFLAIYGCLASIEVGVALNVITKSAPAKWLFTPLWEITNVFLVFGFTLSAFLFGNALNQLSHALMSTLLLAITALLLRALIVLTIFYLQPKRFKQVLAGLLLGLSLFIPLAFASAGVYLLTGQLFWQTSLGWLLMLGASLGLVSNGLLFVGHQTKKIISAPSRMLFLGWIAVIGGIIPLASVYGQNLLPDLACAWLVGVGAIGLLSTIIDDLRAYLWQIASLLSFIVILLLAWFNRPDLVHGSLSLEQSYSGAAFGSLVLIASAVMLPVVIFGFWLLAKVLKQPTTG